MKKLTWWFRIVGGFYLLLAVMNLYVVLLNPSAMTGMMTMPFAVTPDTTMAFVDGWSPFAFELLGIGTFMLWASRNPRRYLSAVWLLIWLELVHGVLDDIYLIARGYDAAGYIGFIVVHLIIIVTGAVFARQAEAAAAGA
ncbi:MAG: BphX family protein [Anaerolineales bacterium]|nr:BphX family protein [Anaerolineales bacterium]